MVQWLPTQVRAPCDIRLFREHFGIHHIQLVDVLLELQDRRMPPPAFLQQQHVATTRS
jgi:hypothetical protein